MIAKCIICGDIFDKKPDKGYDLIPDVCGGKCFFGLIKTNKKKPNKLARLVKLKWINSPVRDFKSTYEMEFDSWLHSWGLQYGFSYLYEPLIFDGEYIPDFLITKYSSIVEVKGRWETGALKKVRRLKAYLEDTGIPVYVVNGDLLRRLRH